MSSTYRGVVQIKTAFELEQWARTAHPGERAIYHHGHLAADRLGNTRSARRVDALASRAHELGEIDWIEMRPCGHVKSVHQAAHRLRLIQRKDEEVEGARFYVAELLP